MNSRPTVSESGRNRIRSFATYFKEYMGVSSIVTAALPIPATVAGLIPTYYAQTRFYSVYSSLFCFLLFGLVFFVRHKLAGILFRLKNDGSFGANWFMYVPPFLMVLCLVFIFSYHTLLNASVALVADNSTSTATILRSTDLRSIPFGTLLTLLYLGIFLSAEGAFVLMATKEYLQSEIGIPDADLFAASLAPTGWCTVNIYSDTNANYAIVDIDGKFAGYIPWKAQLPPGKHLITAKKEGFRTWSRSVTVSANELSLDMEVELVALGLSSVPKSAPVAAP